MKVALLGYDTEGKVSYDYWKNLGADITICDQKTELDVPEGAETQLGEGYLDNLDQFDVLVRTAGMPPRVILDANPGVAGKITTLVNEFMRVCPTRNVIGVTGTKGKGTTSTLITKTLEAAGKTVRLGGNIGVPPFTFLSELDADSWVVLELSSFQLMDLHHSPHIGVCLMIVPEHLNWHEDMDEYTGAKAQLFAQQTSDDVAIYFGDNALSEEIASSGAGQKLPYYRSPGAFVNGNMITIDGQEICTTDELQLLGKHNWQNVCATVTAVWQTGVRDIEAMRSVLTTFTGLEHRLEFVRELDGIKYYDDSFGTTPETAIVAIDAFAEPKVLIAGGSDKGAPFDSMVQKIIESNVAHVICLGETGDTIADLLEAKKNERCVTYTVWSPHEGATMEKIIEAARKEAQPGSIVLLSTGSASFGLFTDYKDRGNQFKAVVSALA